MHDTKPLTVCNVYALMSSKYRTRGPLGVPLNGKRKRLTRTPSNTSHVVVRIVKLLI